MSLYELKQGWVIRQELDEKTLRPKKFPLNTKIVATIGSLTSYGNGLYDLDGTWIPRKRLTYDTLVGGFYRHGVDVIRLNLSHLKAGDVAGTFGRIKRAILECEAAHQGRKRIALLADLEGPKIRFEFRRDVQFRPGQRFAVNFDGRVSAANEETVRVDGKPLRESLSAAAGSLISFPPGGDEGEGGGDVSSAAIVDNALGLPFALPTGDETAFQGMMRRVRERRESGERVLAIIGDGDVVMEVAARGFAEDDSAFNCKVITVKKGRYKGGRKGDHPGFTLKGVDFDVPSFTGTDREKLDLLLDAEYEGAHAPGWEPVIGFVALSFTQTADDVLRIREHLEARLAARVGKVAPPFLQAADDARLHSPMVIAKIETGKGWKNKHHILDVADGIMVARGDLGLQTDIEEVPAIQKKLIRLCNKRGKPVITATEMLKSMTDSIEPTRAEGTDVFNAILDGSDAVMLSEETSKGRHPFNAIRKMLSIATHAERYYERRDMKKDFRRRANLLRYREFLGDDFERIKRNTDRFELIEKIFPVAEALIRRSHLPADEQERANRRLDWRKRLYAEKWDKSEKQRDTNRITEATCTMCEGGDVKCIVAASTTGRTVRMISRLRPSVVIVGAAHDPLNMRKLAVSYGVLPFCIEEVEKRRGTQGIFESFCRRVLEDAGIMLGLLARHDTVIFTAGTPLKQPGTTNTIQMREIEYGQKARARRPRRR